jgi:importin subunit beta-1
VGVLLGSIRDMPHIAEKVCYAMAQLAAGFKDDDSTSLFSPYFKDIVGALLDAVRFCLSTLQLLFALECALK